MGKTRLPDGSTVLFDLDGALLHIDGEAFFPDYFARLGAAVSAYMAPEKFIHASCGRRRP